jgi:hypothetical protein
MLDVDSNIESIVVVYIGLKNSSYVNLMLDVDDNIVFIVDKYIGLKIPLYVNLMLDVDSKIHCLSLVSISS